MNREDCERLTGHCFKRDDVQVVPAVHPPPEGFPWFETCRHCSARRKVQPQPHLVVKDLV